MRLFLAVCLYLMFFSAVLAQDRRNSETCRDNSIETGDRIAACNAVIQSAEDDDARATALVRLGIAHEENENIADAEAAILKALAVRPNYVFALKRLAILQQSGDRLREALTTMQLAVSVDAQDYWNHYYLGRVLLAMRDYQSAIPYFDASIALDPDYFWSHFRRGQAYDRLGENESAGNSYALAARIRPFSRSAHQEAFTAFEDAGFNERAAFHVRMIFSFDPNELAARDWLLAYHLSDKAPDLLPMAWQPLSTTKELRYLRVLAPVDEREETQIAIEEMINFFGGNSYPIPESKLVYTSTLGETHGDVTSFIVKEIDSEGDVPSVNERPSHFRGLFPIEIFPLGPEAPGIRAVFEGKSPADVWPLSVGNAASGTGRFVVQCPEKLNPPGLIMGCRSDNNSVDVGEINWSISVESTQTIHVPYGIFDTYVLRYAQDASITIMGATNPIDLDAQFWIAPALNTWIQRRVFQDSKFLTNQLMEVNDVD